MKKQRDTPIDFERLTKVCSPWPKGTRFGNDIYKSQLHLHWPYTKKIIYQGGMFGRCNLKKPDSRLRCRKMSRDRLIAVIYKEVANAMHYPVVVHPDKGFEHQAIEAFSMWQLISGGWHYWQHPKLIPKPWGKTALADAKMHRKKGDARSVAQTAERYLGYWKKYGRYIALAQPIERMTKPELEAIYVIVCDSFENQC